MTFRRNLPRLKFRALINNRTPVPGGRQCNTRPLERNSLVLFAWVYTTPAKAGVKLTCEHYGAGLMQGPGGGAWGRRFIFRWGEGGFDWGFGGGHGSVESELRCSREG